MSLLNSPTAYSNPFHMDSVQRNLLTVLAGLLNTNRPRADVNKAKVVGTASDYRVVHKTLL